MLNIKLPGAHDFTDLHQSAELSAAQKDKQGTSKLGKEKLDKTDIFLM